MIKKRYFEYVNKTFSSLVGKTYVVTGGNSGIGYCLVEYLLYLGAKVVIASRSKDRILKAIESLQNVYTDAIIDYLLLDQSNIESIEHFALELQSKYPIIDGFVFNAGLFHPNKKTAYVDGFSLTVLTNYLGTFYLSKSLDAYFNSIPDIHVCHVGSLVFHNQNIKNTGRIWSEGHANLSRQYASSKKMQMVLGHFLNSSYSYPGFALERKYQARIATPGISQTNIIGSLERGFKLIGRWAMGMFFQPAAKAALPPLYALLKDDVASDCYVIPRGIFELGGYPKVVKIPRELMIDPTELFISTEEALNKLKLIQKSKSGIMKQNGV